MRLIFALLILVQSVGGVGRIGGVATYGGGVTASGIALVAANSAWATSSTATSHTTAALNTTGATTLFVICPIITSSVVVTVSDNKSNTGWTAATVATFTSGDGGIQLFYNNAFLAGGTLTVGSGHTFTCTNATSTFSSAAAMAFSGTQTTATPLVAQANSTANAATISASVTTTAVNQLVVTVFAGNAGTAGTTVAIGGGFNNVIPTTISTWNVGVAWSVQPTAAAVAPTWTASSADLLGMNIGAYH